MFRMKLAWVAGLLAAAACAPQPQKVDFVVLDQDIPIDQIHLAPTSTPRPGPETMTLAEAGAALPFAIGLPAWAPAGFTLLDEVEVTPAASVDLAWQNPDGETINLTLSTSAPAESRLAGAGTVETVTVNGQPASLRRTTGLGGAGARQVLTWSAASVSYRLAAPAAAFDTAALIRMAESIP